MNSVYTNLTIFAFSERFANSAASVECACQIWSVMKQVWRETQHQVSAARGNEHPMSKIGIQEIINLKSLVES